ncbi:putative Origin recognition complex subunit 5 [Nannochloris sp. 'desiccata']|nr:putative Origin recognition complex subunit 5 [Chlorella desiccata (nom. nud.)]
MPPRKQPAQAEPEPPTASRIDVKSLKQRYPGRETQIDDLATLFGSNRNASNPVFVYGPPGTGKTSVLRDLLKHLKITQAYVSCHETTRTRTVLESILHQIKGTKRRREDGYGPSMRCDSMGEFLAVLPSAVSRKKGAAWIIIDNAQRLAGADLLSMLTRLPDATSSNVGVCLIANIPWATGKFISTNQNLMPPHPVHFPAYTGPQLQRILAGSLPPGEDTAAYASKYHQFLSSTVGPMSRASNNVLDLRTAIHALWIQYSAPLKEGRDLPAGALFNKVRGELQRVIGELEMGGKTKSMNIGSSNSTDGGGRINGASGSGDTVTLGVPTPSAAPAPAANTGTISTTPSADPHLGLTIELPYMSKFLLLAAYIASRNKATADRAVFDPGYSKRGRKDAQAHDRQTEAATENLLKGPHSFPLERLLHIFYCIYDQHCAEDGDFNDDIDGVAAPRNAAAAHEVQRAEVQMQISTLVALRLLSVSGGDLLEGGIYRCNLAQEIAYQIAGNVKMRLNDYMKLA